MAVAGDVQPQTTDEIEYATTVMREVAAKRFDSRNAASDAARIASVFINALPLSGPENARRAASCGSPWRMIRLGGATPEGLAMAKDMYRACQISVDARSTYSMRYCLELRHADLQATSNHAILEGDRGLLSAAKRGSHDRMCGLYSVSPVRPVLAGGGAQAAPQVLGIVASNGPMPLTCDAAVAGSISAPSACSNRGTIRSPARPIYPWKAPTSSSSAAMRRAIRCACRPRLILDFRTIAASPPSRSTLTTEKLAALGLRDLAIEIGEKASLLPAEAVDDRDPQTKDEIALATGAPTATKGAEFFDKTGESGDAIRLANRMINALPPMAVAPAIPMATCSRRQSPRPRGRPRHPKGIAAGARHVRDLPAKGRRHPPRRQHARLPRKHP